MLTKLRISLFVLLFAGLAACATSTSAPAPTAAIEKGIDEPFFIQPERMTEKATIVKSGKRIDVLFVGDSITQNYDMPDYRPVWNRSFAPLHALNLGYGMDTTGAAHWRIVQGELNGINPRVTVLLLGTNDTNLGRSPDQVVAGIARVIKDLKVNLPKTKILLVGILPSDRSSDKTSADKEVNAKNAAFYADDPRVTFIDTSSVFMKDGVLNADLYVEKKPEGALHPNPKGQGLMAAAIEPAIASLLNEKPDVR
ncbi:MAG: GDSL-type esterase/lipase family protein [Parvibaculum sp.]|nr:GDSL-type esterase/lipase family protein [Parvibaculum sp.]